MGHAMPNMDLPLQLVVGVADKSWRAAFALLEAAPGLDAALQPTLQKATIPVKTVLHEGRTRALQWLVEHGRVPLDVAFQRAAGMRHYGMCCMLAAKGPSRDIVVYTLRVAARNHFLNLCAWLVKYFRVTRYEIHAAAGHGRWVSAFNMEPLSKFDILCMAISGGWF